MGWYMVLLPAKYMGPLLTRCTRIWPITILPPLLKKWSHQPDQIQQRFSRQQEPSSFRRDRRSFHISLSKKCRMFFMYIFHFTLFYIYLLTFSIKGSGGAAGRKKSSSVRKRAGPQPNQRKSSTPPSWPRSRVLCSDSTQTPSPVADAAWRPRRASSCHKHFWRVRSCC